MQIRAYFSTPPSAGSVLRNSAPLQMAARTARRREAGITLVETVISLMVVMIGLAGLFATAAQSFRLLRRSKEVVAVRECLLTRLDSIRALSFAQVSKSSSMTSSTTNLMVTGALGDPNPFAGTTSGMKNFTETITAYALGSQIFSSDTQRQNATPDYTGQFASQVDTLAPNPPKTYQANSTTPGLATWVPQPTDTLTHYQITRVGTGANAQVTVNAAADLSTAAALRVDVTYTWTDSSNVTRSQVGSVLVAKYGSLQ